MYYWGGGRASQSRSCVCPALEPRKCHGVASRRLPASRSSWGRLAHMGQSGLWLAILCSHQRRGVTRFESPTCDLVSDPFVQLRPAMEVVSSGGLRGPAHEIRDCTNACSPLNHSVGINNCGPMRGLTGTVIRLMESLWDLRISGKVRTGPDLTLQVQAGTAVHVLRNPMW